ncbi:MAG: AbrB/MazE/SpoVT family DNA-binding domain-containing protein [Desulfuromonadaceae bacterium]
MLARKTSKNQLTLPKEVVGNFPGIDLFDASVENNRIILTPVKIVPIDPSMDKIRKKMASLGIVENDVAEAIQWARN